MEIDLSKYTVCRDTKEQVRGNRWEFPNMVEESLKTGDYCLKDWPDLIVLERKGCVSEWATNIFEARFVRELERLESFKYPFIILEFELKDIVLFPATSSIPQKVWPKLKVNAGILMKKVSEWSLKYKTKIMFAGPFGKNLAESLFKRVLEIECPNST